MQSFQHQDTDLFLVEWCNWPVVALAAMHKVLEDARMTTQSREEHCHVQRHQQIYRRSCKVTLNDTGGENSVFKLYRSEDRLGYVSLSSLLYVSQCVPCLTRVVSMRLATIYSAPVSPAIKDYWASHGLGFFFFCMYLSNNCAY